MSSQTGFANEPVVKDGNTELHLEELRLIVDSWTPEMKEAAATDDAALYNLLNQAVAIKKMAQQAEEMTPEKDGVDYWRKEMAKQKTMQVFIFRQFTDSLVVPDLTALAKERYQTQKKKYAWIPEKRQSSHILLRCAPPKCLWQSRGEEMKEIQAELDIMPFEDVARNRSEDVGTARKGGSLSLAVALTDPQVDKAYRKALFELEKVGQVSPMVGSSFGLHLIRLDAIEEGYFRPYNQVRDAIVSDITTEYKKMKVREYNESFRFTDETSIDDAAMRELLAPYKD
ncbi:MAG: peptidylprolyl isomerase [Halioglobus sp.]